MNTPHKILIVTTGFDKESEAEACLLYLLENKLVACGHIYKERSIYHWNGALHNGDEWMLTVKTTESLWEDVEDSIKAMHPYEVPMIIGTIVNHANADYAQWIASSCVSDQK